MMVMITLRKLFQNLLFMALLWLLLTAALYATENSLPRDHMQWNTKLQA